MLYYCFIQRPVRSDTALGQALSAYVKPKLSCPSSHGRTQSRPSAAESPPPDWNVFSFTYKLVIDTTIIFYYLHATAEDLFTESNQSQGHLKRIEGFWKRILIALTCWVCCSFWLRGFKLSFVWLLPSDFPVDTHIIYFF